MLRSESGYLSFQVRHRVNAIADGRWPLCGLGETGESCSVRESMFGRIKNLLTPPPSQAPDVESDAPPAPDAREEEMQFNTALRTSLESLITAPGLRSEEAVEAVATLKNLAKSRGPYVTAARLRMQLEARRPDSTSGEPADTGRGYMLAADFILQHMVREIEAIEHKSVGPNIFKAYCNDLVDCLARGRKVRRCIEIPVMTMDSLLARALNSGRYRNVYVEMARQVVIATEEVVSQRVERDERTARQRTRESRNTETPAPAPSEAPDPMTSLDKPSAEYLTALLGSIEKIKEGFANYGELPALSEQDAATGKFERPQLDAHRSYLAGLLPVAESSGYAPFLAMVKGRLGTLMSHADPEVGKRLRIEAAQAYEAQGDREDALHYKKLIIGRYRAAAEHYRRAGDEARSNAVLAKAGTADPDA